MDVNPLSAASHPNPGITPEMPQTRSNKGIVAATDDNQLEADSVPEEPRRKLRNRKTRKNASKPTGAAIHKTRRRGKLRMLPEMPLDILFEIFGLLEPFDVLRLARTTKALRNVLMSRTAISIWKRAFSNDELPNRPDDLTEPQYANLAFSEHCHYCLCPGMHTVLWVFRVRSCANCIPKHFGAHHQILHRLLPSGPLFTHMDLLCQVQRGTKGPLYSYTETDAVNQELVEIQNDTDRLKLFIDKRMKIVENLQSHAMECDAAVPLREQRRSLVIKQIREKRKEMICKRLTDLGFGEEIKQLNAADPNILSEHELISAAKDLTDRIWNNIMPALVEFMECARAKLLKRQRKSLLKKRQRILVAALEDFVLTRPPHELVISTADICNMPEVKTMLEDPPDVEITMESFADFFERLPRLCEEWRKLKSRDLLALMPTSTVNRTTAGPEETFTRLELATTYFQCNACTEPISYPRILEHGCMTALHHGYRNREDDTTLMFLNLKSEPWNYAGNKIRYHQAAATSARSVIQSSGLDPDFATAGDLDEADQWLECLHCSHRVKGRAVFRWKKAILHDMYHVDWERGSSLWMRLNEEDATTAVKQEEAMMSTHRDTACDYSCVRCRFGERMDLLAIKSHILLRFVHDIQPVKKEDYRLHIDASMDQPPFPITIPYQKEPVFIDITGDDNPPANSPELEYLDIPNDDSEDNYIVISD